MEIRLQKWLSQSGIASRRKAEQLILAGQVAVNGNIITELGARANIATDTVTVNGRPCTPYSQMFYIALHKPEGVVTTKQDQFNRPTVMDLLPPNPGEICHPVGRLDYDSSGLLILTNDGALTQQLTHPKYGVTKTYVATVKGVPSTQALAQFSSGLVLDDYDMPTAKCEVEIITKNENAKLRIKLKEGRNRQVRKMCEAIGHPVISLKRVAMGAVSLGSLPRGQWRYLTAAEVKQLKG